MGSLFVPVVCPEPCQNLGSAADSAARGLIF